MEASATEWEARSEAQGPCVRGNLFFVVTLEANVAGQSHTYQTRFNMSLEVILSQPLPWALAAMTASTAFASVGLHLSTTEAEVKEALPIQEAVRHFQLSYPLLKTMQVGYVITSAACGAAAAALSGGLTRQLFIGGSALAGVVLPFTLFTLIPINNALLEAPLTTVGTSHRELLNQWATINWVRPVLTFASTVAFGVGVWRIVYRFGM